MLHLRARCVAQGFLPGVESTPGPEPVARGGRTLGGSSGTARSVPNVTVPTVTVPTVTVPTVTELTDRQSVGTVNKLPGPPRRGERTLRVGVAGEGEGGEGDVARGAALPAAAQPA